MTENERALLVRVQQAENAVQHFKAAVPTLERELAALKELLTKTEEKKAA